MLKLSLDKLEATQINLEFSYLDPQEKLHPSLVSFLLIYKNDKKSNCFSISDGMTYFSALDLKFGIAHVPLSDHKLAQFRDNLSELDLIILDEVSLIGADMLYRIHMRLREIFQCNDLFANKSILLVGDLLQLKPVKATYIFNKP